MKNNFVLGIMILLGVWCLLYVGIKIDMWRLGYEMEELKVQRTALKKEQEHLQVRLSKLTDPQQIAQRAQRQLDLMIPQEGQVIMVSVDQSVGQTHPESSSLQLVQEFTKIGVTLP